MSKILTIVIPTYNAEATINNALMSLNYKYQHDFNVLIVDDGGSRPVKKFIQPWIDRFPSIIKCVRKTNGNWGSVVNYAARHVNTKFIKILDADDTFIFDKLGEIIHYLKHLKSNVDVVLSSFYFSLDMRQNKITPRKISKKSSIIYTTFDKFKTNSILTHHALCFNTKFLLNKLHVEERFRFSDNILIYKVILFSKKIAILPKQFILYRYHIGVPEQQTSLEQMVNHYQDARKTLTIISQIKLDNHMSKRRIKTLWIILKSMYFFSLILISLNKKLYFWQKKMNFELIKKSVEQARKNGYDKIIKQSPIPFLNKLNFFSTKTISVAAFKLIQVGFIKIIKDSERLTKNKKSIY